MRAEIVIIFKECDPFLMESVEHCLNLDYKDFNILLLPDYELDFPIHNPKIRVIATGNVSISKKRNIGIKNSGDVDVIAFIDSDAYPDKYWLKNSIPYLNDAQVMAVGGPNLTPPNDDLSRKIPGYVMAQKIAIGDGAVRQRISSNHFAKELPTCNLIVRKALFEQILFDENQYTGEDAKLCYEIVKMDKKIQYAHNVIVFHHRRKLLSPFLLQFYNYGFDKGKLFLDKNLTSNYYVAPAMFVLMLVGGGIVSCFNNVVLTIFSICLLIYFVIIFFSSYKACRILFLSSLVGFVIFLGHLSYGVGFLSYIFMNFINKKSMRKYSLNRSSITKK